MESSKYYDFDIVDIKDIASLHSEEDEMVKEEDTSNEISNGNIVCKDLSYSYRYISALASGSLNDST